MSGSSGDSGGGGLPPPATPPADVDAATVGTIVAIFVAAERGAPVEALPRVEADRRGIVGDRNRKARYRRGTAVTFVAEEDVAACAAALGVTITPADTRRNVVTRGVDLAGLVGVRFRLGSVELLGVERCDPCGLLERRTHRGVRARLHGGLRCDVIGAGVFAVGDAIAPLAESSGAVG